MSKLLVIATACGIGGGLLGLMASIFAKSDRPVRTELAVGIGFLVGGALGALFGIFAILADRV